MGNELNLELGSLEEKAIESRASACGKAILVGEHAVVYGARAVAIPLNSMRLNLAIEPCSRRGKVPLVTMKMADRQMSKRVSDVFVEAAVLLGVEKFSAKITGHSSLPIGAGVGSSAALCVGVLRGISQCLGLSLSKAQLAGLGNGLEQRFHGNPSGLDAAVVAYESSLLFQRGSEIEVLNVKEQPVKFALVDSGVRSSTMAMIRLASPFFRGTRGAQRIQEFDEVSDVTGRALEQGDISTLVEGVKRCDRLLDELGVVTDSLRLIIEDSLALGCLAAKTTGAGGGGVVLTVLNPQNPQVTLDKLKHFFGSSRVFPFSL